MKSVKSVKSVNLWLKTICFISRSLIFYTKIKDLLIKLMVLSQKITLFTLFTLFLLFIFFAETPSQDGWLTEWLTDWKVHGAWSNGVPSLRYLATVTMNW